MIRKLFSLIVFLLLPWVVLHAFSPLQQKTIFDTTDRILEVTKKQPQLIKIAILEVREILSSNYLPPAVIEVFEETVRNLVPYLQCPVLDCVSDDPACTYDNLQIDDRWCTISCGELSCSCDQVVCEAIPSYCSYPDQVKDSKGCLTDCGEYQCECPIQNCPSDGQCYGASYDAVGCIAECFVTECPAA
jgi:predicted secreted protein